MTPVTTTLACTDPVHPIVRYLPFGNPSGTFTVAGDQATITPGATSSNTEVVFNYWAENAIFERTLGFLRVQVGGAPIPPPPVNLPPMARCDSYSVKPGEILDVRRPGVLANDTDPEGFLLRAQDVYGSAPKFPMPGIEYTGRLRFQPPGRGRMFSYRYVVTDGEHQTESTVTIWVGTKDKGCRPAFDPPPRSNGRDTYTLMKTSGTVRIRVGGRWRHLGGRYKLTRAVLVDARQGGVRVRHVVADDYTRRVTWGRFSGGVFKLGKTQKLPNGQRQLILGTIALAGGSGCSGGAGPGRQLRVTATGFIFEALRMRVIPLAIRNRLVPARFTLSDRCNGSSVVRSRAGRIHVTDRGTRGTYVFRGTKTYVARR